MPQWSTTNIGKDFSTSNYYSGNVTNNLPAVIPISDPSGARLLQVITRKYRAGLCRTMTYVIFWAYSAKLTPTSLT